MPELIVQDPEEDVYVLLGDNVMFTCTVQYPEGAENELMVDWTEGGLKLKAPSTKNLANRTVTSVLSFTDIQADASAAYFCAYQLTSTKKFYGKTIELEVQCECDIAVTVSVI